MFMRRVAIGMCYLHGKVQHLIDQVPNGAVLLIMGNINADVGNEGAAGVAGVSFGRDTKSCWSLLSGVYARGSKRSHTGK